MCGEQLLPIYTSLSCLGSSPRVRGTGSSNNVIKAATGIIPACAGNSRNPRFLDGKSRDHPRVCGEQVASATVHGLVEGSSPRVRGTGRCRLRAMMVQGIIPACAGNRDVPSVLRCVVGDHPRVCGEQMASEYKGLTVKGSSPRVRGTVFLSFLMK